MQIKSKSGWVFNIPSPKEEAEINAGIASDPDARELSEDEMNRLRPEGRPSEKIQGLEVE